MNKAPHFSILCCSFVLLLMLPGQSHLKAAQQKAADWTLGPTGLRGWARSEKSTTEDARQIFITEVESGSPAAGILERGDIIQGVDGKEFDSDPRVQFGRAITVAEEEQNRGRLNLLIYRQGKQLSKTLKLPVMGRYSATAPVNCPKSRKIFEQGCEVLAQQMKADPDQGHVITRSLNALALLSSGDEKYFPLLREQARRLSTYNQEAGVRTWQFAYVNLFLAEYVLATGDRSFVEEGLQRISSQVVNGQSAVGSWGHDFAVPGTGRLKGYGMMNAPGVPLTYSLVLAREAQVDVPGLDEAIEKSRRLLRFYVDKGSIPYGDHDPWIQTHDDNGKNGMAAVLFNDLNDPEATTYFTRMSVASHGAERDLGHTGNFFNMLWALPGVARSGPEATGAWMKEFGWHYDLARRWDGTFRYQGPPREKREVYDRWDCTGAYLLGYSQLAGETYLTGRRKSVAPQISRQTAESLLEDGRGWSNKDRNSYYDGLSQRELIERLGSWSPIVRERAALALGRKKDDVTPDLIRLLGSSNRFAQYGACQAIQMQKGRAAKSVPALLSAFRSSDVWLRILAGEALVALGNAAKPVIPLMLERLSQPAGTDDPRNMEQRYLSMALFNKRGGLLGRSLEGVDRDQLFRAVRAGLTNQDGRARSSLATVYENLTYEELKPLLPAIYDAIVEPAPSGIMFADGIQTSGLKLFAQHHIDEGIELLVDYGRNQKKHGSQKRIITVMNLLKSYGAHAQRVIPQLEEMADYFENDEEGFPKKLSQDKAKLVRETIESIQASREKPNLRSLNP